MRALAAPVQLGRCVSKDHPRLLLPVSLSKHGPSAWRLTRRSICRPCNQLSSETEDILKKYGVGAAAAELPGRQHGGRKPRATRRPALAAGMGNGVFSLLVINFGMYAAATLFHLPLLSTLALRHWAPKWWQFVSATFVHADWQHLTGNAFSLLVFGKIVEEEEGAVGVWLTYLLCGIGGCIASYYSASHTAALSLGASASVFGLFAVAVLLKFQPSIRKLVEAVVLGSFVLKQVANEVHVLASRGNGNGWSLVQPGSNIQVGHWAHLAGAAVGVIVVLALSRLPKGTDEEEIT